MNGKARVLAVAVVAMFCLTAVAVAEHADDSAAADQKTYHIYVEFMAKEKLKVTHGVWIEFSCEKSPSQYAEAANKALKDAVKGFDDIGDVNMYGVTNSEWGISF